MSELDGINLHFQELRKRLLRIVLVIGIITAFILTFHAEPIQVNEITLYYPTFEPLNNIAAQITNHMKLNLVPENVQLIQTAPGQAFFAQVHIAALVGIVIGMPVIIRELVGFIKPALKENEINVSRSITIPALGLFIAGCVFSYNFVIPYILEFLYRYGESAGLVTFLGIMEFVTFVLQFLLAFGFSFQLPLVMYAISASGMVEPDFWRKNLRYAIVIIVIFGAVITPDGSGITMWFIAVPMILLYVAGMISIERKERKKLNT
ncbi:twin-arginine translocase subunit TatC [Marine Group I thaumarchaeote]|uniref:Sec-independent protein translocase protein TatC n=1 Tax=Marine Group I thaumarchaeote TaxID=2511932 RepID=A0A7K4N7G1_9ARCH|nr:twin-arginine translocase subunit TatC [Candidatus Nitrosopumilus sp. MTA1]NWJ28983.1 twin-arginine translocase subunit TatC [Marine Group I thaumarchaeote]NWJ57499.1 twin-arginine translocase subunit TatC [Marine Group I thaumarchaeote]NWJ84314.1 twin-arginine translocase subunit TatC [Marine Group I thaumarchaeote]NWK01403.1 twin-arginine translocase subunit TatC [Marine Group I thaumarchaeote]